MKSNRDASFILSVIVPCYNEEEVISITHHELTDKLSNFENFEIIYINDGSTDSTLNILLNLQKNSSFVKIINFSRNFGHQPAVLAGLEFSSGNCVAIIDADLQDPPSLIPKMVELWKDGNDVIYAVRKKRKENFFKKTSYFFFYRLQALLSDIKIPLDSGDFCLIDRNIVNIIKKLPEKNKYLRGLRAWTGFKQKELVYERSQRHSGTSKYTLKMLFLLAVSGITNFSIFPLRFISISGVAVFFISIILSLLILIQKFFNFKIFGVSPNDVPGWTSIFLLFLIISGINFIFLGIMGEYLGKIYGEVKNRPNYLIESIYGFDNE